MDAIPWAILTLLTNVFGLVTYLVIRYPEPRTCKKCGADLPIGFKRCPYCGSENQSVCPSCQCPLQANWIYCPSCGFRIPIPDAEANHFEGVVSVSGSVLDAASGRPIQGAAVRIDSKKENRSTITDSAGLYVISELPVRPYVVEATADGYNTESRGYVPISCRGRAIDFALRPIMNRSQDTVEEAAESSEQADRNA